MISKLFSLQGKIAVVTGAGANGGIGHAIALGLARAGASVAVADIDEAGLAQTAAELAELGLPHRAHACDISSPAQVEALFEAVQGHFGGIDILVNVPFAFPRRAPPHQVDLEDWQHMLDVNVTGYFLCIRAAVPLMLAGGRGGSILNIGSNAGVSALGRGAFPYSCTKGAINQMTKELAVEYAAQRIRCNALLPAQTLTPGLKGHLDNPGFRDQVLPRILAGLPQGRLLEPEDFVGPAVFLSSPAAAAVNGVLLPVDGGNLALNAGGSAGAPAARP